MDPQAVSTPSSIGMSAVLTSVTGQHNVMPVQEAVAGFSGLSVSPAPQASTSSCNLPTEVSSVLHQATEPRPAELKKRTITTGFKRFRSIEESSNRNYIEAVFRHKPKLQEALYVGSEKLDGANLTVLIDSENIRYFSRSGNEVTAEQPFFDAPMTLKKYKEDFKKIQSALGTMECQSFTLRGEYFGSGINRRIDYGPKKFAPFIIEKNGQAQSHQQFRAFMDNMQFAELKPVPLLFSGLPFEEALKFDLNLVTRARTDAEGQPIQVTDSAKSLTVHDYIEGIVIQPGNYCLKDGEKPFLLKKRSENYQEIENKGARLGKEKNKGVKSSELNKNMTVTFFSDFLDYITENRIINVISQRGELSSSKEVGSIVMAVLQDAKKDYCKDHADAEIESRIPAEVNRPARSKAVKILHERYPELFSKKPRAENAAHPGS